VSDDTSMRVAESVLVLIKLR